MLSADVVVAELPGLFKGQFKDALGSRREGDFDGNEAGATADDLFHLNASVLEVDAHRLQNLGGNSGAFSDQSEQDLLGANEVVTKPASLLLGQHDHLDGLLGKTFEHREADTQV